MNEMIERVARAMHAIFNEKGFGDYTYAWEDPLAGREYFLTLARAAIEAMREPTEAMAPYAFENTPLQEQTPWNCDPADVWRTMIDAALAATPTPA